MTARVAARGALDRAVLAVWRELFGAAVDLDTSFFDLGATSLSAARLARALRERTGRAVTTGLVLDWHTPAAQAAGISLLEVAPVGEGATDDDGGIAPASVQQEVIWFLEQIQPHNTAYNTTVAVWLDGSLDVARLRAALKVVIGRHGVFATAFDTVDGELVQLPGRPVDAELEVVDLAGAEAEVDQRIRQLGQVRFDTGRPPLIRWSLIRVAPDRHVLVQVEHHFVHDGWSMWIVLSELAAAYRRDDSLPPAPTLHAYRGFARAQRRGLAGPVADVQRRWWAGSLAGCDESVRFARDAERPAVFDHRGGTVERSLPAEVAAAVRRMSAGLRVTPFAILLAGFEAAIGAHCGCDRFAIGSMLRNRRDQDAGVVGMFVNTIALPVRDWAARSFRELALLAAAQIADAEENQGIPFPLVVDDLGRERDLSRNAVFQICFSMNDWPAPRLDLGPELAAEVRFPSNGGAKFDLDTVVLPEADSWRLLWRYYAAVLDPAEVAAVIDRYTALLLRVAAAPDVPLADLCRGQAGRE